MVQVSSDVFFQNLLCFDGVSSQRSIEHGFMFRDRFLAPARQDQHLVPKVFFVKDRMQSEKVLGVAGLDHRLMEFQSYRFHNSFSE